MKNILINILAVIVGYIVGAVVNLIVVGLGEQIILPPANVDMTSMESVKSSAHLFEARHFIFPLAAHTSGSFFGALAAVFIARSRAFIIAAIVGSIFLLGGVLAILMIPAPTWFIVADLIIAYVPTVWLAWKIGEKLKPDLSREKSV